MPLTNDDAVGKLLANYLTKNNQSNKIPILDDQGIFTGDYYDKRISQGPENQPDQERLSIHLTYMEQKYGKQYQPQQGQPIAGGFDPVDIYESQGFGESVGNVSMASVNESIIGVGYKALSQLFGDGQPEDIFDMSHWSPSDKEEFMVGVGSLVADTPLFLIGGGAGGVAGKALVQAGVRKVASSGLKTGSKKLLGEAVGRAMKQVPGSVGAFAGHTAIKEGVRASYEPTTMEDYITQIAKSGATGAVMGGVGGVLGGQTTKAITGRVKQSGKAVKAGESSLAKTKVQAAIRKNRSKLDKSMAFAGEVGAFTVIDPAFEGRLPTVQDFSHALGTIVGLKLAHKIPGMAQKAWKKYTNDKKDDRTGKFNSDLAKSSILEAFVSENPEHPLSTATNSYKESSASYEKLKKEVESTIREMDEGPEKDAYRKKNIKLLNDSLKQLQKDQSQYAEQSGSFFKENKAQIKGVSDALNNFNEIMTAEKEQASIDRLDGQVPTAEDAKTTVDKSKKLTEIIEKKLSADELKYEEDLKNSGQGFSEKKEQPDYKIPENKRRNDSEQLNISDKKYSELEDLKGKSVEEIQNVYRKLALKLYDQGKADEAADVLTVAAKLRDGDSVKSSRYSKNGYEVSTQGDKRFSAFNARLKDGRTIEEAYQIGVKGHDSVKAGKGKPPKNKNIDTYKEYKKLWEQWAIENPALMRELYQKIKGGKVLTDKFATTDTNQARALAEILTEKFADNTGKETNASLSKKLDYQFLKYIPESKEDGKIHNRFVAKFKNWATKMVDDIEMLDLLRRAEDAYTKHQTDQDLTFDEVGSNSKNSKWLSKQNKRPVTNPSTPENFWRRFQKEYEKIAGDRYDVSHKKSKSRDFGTESKSFSTLSKEVSARIVKFKKYVEDGLVRPLSKMLTKSKPPKNIKEIDALEAEIQKLDPNTTDKIIFLRAMIRPIAVKNVTVTDKKAIAYNEVTPSMVYDIVSAMMDGNYIQQRRGGRYSSTESFTKNIRMKDGSRLVINRPTISFGEGTVHLKFSTERGKHFDGTYKLSDGTSVGDQSLFEFTKYKHNLEALKKDILKNQTKMKLAQVKAVEEATKEVARNPIYVRDYDSIKNPAVKELIDSMIPLGHTPTKIHIIAPDLLVGDKKPPKKFQHKKTSFDAEREMLYGEGRSGYVLAEIPSKKLGKNILLLLDVYTPTDFGHTRNTFDPFYHITMTNLLEMSKYGKVGDTEMAKYWSPALIDTPMFRYAKRLGFGATQVSEKYYKVTKLDEAGILFLEKFYNDLSTVGFIKEIEKAISDFNFRDPIKYIRDIQRDFFETILSQTTDKTRFDELVKDLGPVFTKDQIELRYQENETGFEGSKQTPAGRLSSVKRTERATKLKEKVDTENFVEHLTEREGEAYLRFLKEEMVRDHDLLESEWNNYDEAKRNLERQIIGEGRDSNFSILEKPDGEFGYSAKKFQYIWDKLNPNVRAVKVKDKNGKEEIIAPITLAMQFLQDMKISLSDYFKLPDVEAEYIATNGFLRADIGSATFNGETLGSRTHTAHEVFHHIGLHLERGGFKLSNYEKSLRKEAYDNEADNFPEFFARFGDRFVSKNAEAKSWHPELYKDTVLMLKKMADGKGYEAIKNYMDGLARYDKAREEDIRSAVKAKTFERDASFHKHAVTGVTSALYNKFVNSYHGIAKLMEFIGVDRKGVKNTEHYALASAGGAKIQGDSIIRGVLFLRNRDLSTTRKPELKNLVDIFRSLGTSEMAEDMIMHRIIETADLYFKKPKRENGKIVKDENGKVVLDPEDIGFTPSEIIAFRKFMSKKSPTERAKIEQASEDFKKILDLVIDQQLIAGMIKTEKAEGIKKYNPHYVTIIKDLIGNVRDGITLGEEQIASTGFATSKQTIRKFLNRQGIVDNPLQSTINYINTSLASASNRMVMDNLFDNLTGHRGQFMEKGGLGDFIKQIEGVALEKLVVGKMNLDMDMINEVLNPKGIKAESSSGAKISKEDYVMMEVMAQNIKPDGPNIITYRGKDGKVRFYQVSGEIMEAFVDYANVDRGSGINMLLKAAKVPTDIVRMFAVTYNPVFMMKNIPRDILTALVQTQTKLSVGEILKGYKDSWRMVFGKGKLTDLEQQYLDSGIVESNFSAYADRASRGREAEMLIKQEGMNSLSKIAQFIKKAGSATESGPRFAEFKKSFEAGEGSVTARLKARDITVNFLRAGKYSQVLSQLIPFFNPGIQGADKMIRTGFSKEFMKVGMIRAASAILAPTITMWMMNKDEEWYKNLTPSDKALWWHFKIPGEEQILRVPKPYDFGMLFGSLPEAMLNYMVDRDADAFFDFSSKIQERLIPFSPNPLKIIPETIGSVAAVRPFMQMWANRNFYFDKPIVSYFTERKPTELQYYSNTSEIFKALGDNPIYKLSPLKIKQFASDITAGQSDLLVKSLDWVGSFVGDVDKQTYQERKQREEQEKYGSLYYKIMPFIKPIKPASMVNTENEFLQKDAISKIKALLKEDKIDRIEYRQREREIKLKYRKRI